MSDALHIGIVGLGLVGGSLAKALARVRPRWQRWGCDPDAASLASALHAQALHHAAPSMKELLDSCDLVVLCQPVDALLNDLKGLDAFSRLPVLCDVASVKRSVLAAVDATLGERSALRGRFVGAHPIAGKALSGWTAADADLFVDCRVVLCPEGADAEAVALVQELWLAVGALPQTMSASQHDAVFAVVSHLPQLLTWAYLHSVGSAPGWPEARALAGPGFASFSRLATSSPALWTGIALHNRQALIEGLDHLGVHLDRLRHALHRCDGPALQEFFAAARAMVVPPFPPGGHTP